MFLLSTLKIRKKKLSLLTILSFFALFNAPPAFADNSKSYQLVDLSNDLSTIVRILNGIALSQGLNDGTVDAKEVVRELLNLKPGVTLDDLEKDNVTGLADDLAGLSTAVENECGGDKAPCVGNLKAISLGLTALERIPRLPSADFASLFIEDSSLNVMAKVKNSYDDVVKAKVNVQNLIDAIGNMTSSAQFNQLDVVYFFKKSLENLQSTTTFSNGFTQAQVEALDQTKLKAALGVLTKLGAIPSSFDKERTTASELHEKMEKLEKVTSSLKSLLSSEAIAINEKKIAFLIDIKGGNKLLQTEKTLTNGFFKGFRDFDQLTLDLKTPFVKDILTNGTGTESLQNTFSSLFSMSKNLEPLLKIQEPSQLTDFIDNSQKLKDDLDAASLEMESFTALIAFTDCSAKLNKLASEVRIKDWLGEEHILTSAGDAPKTFSEKFNGIKLTSSDFDTLKSLIDSSNNDKTITDVKSHQDIDSIKTNINNLKTNLDAIDPNSLEWAKGTKIADLIPSTSKWFKENELDSISQCLNDKQSISEAKTEIGKRESLTAVLNLKSDNKFITEVSNAVTSQKATITAWNEFKKAQKTRTTRAANTDKTLKDALKLTRDLSAAAKVFRDLAAFHTSEKDFDELINAEKMIDDAIGKGNDDNLKNEIGKVWNSDTKYTLKNLKPLTDTVNKNIKVKPGQLSDFTQYFKIPLNFDKMVDLHIKLLITFLQSIKIPNSVYENLKFFDDMSFVNGKVAMITASDSFLLIISFFKSWSSLASSTGKYKKPEDESVSSSSGSLSLGVILGIIGGCVVLVILFIGFCVWKKKKKSKVDPKVKFDKDLNFCGRLKRRIDNWIHKKTIKKREKPEPDPPKVNPDVPATEPSTAKTKDEKEKEEDDLITKRDTNEINNKKEKYVMPIVKPITMDEKVALSENEKKQMEIDHALKQPGTQADLIMLTPQDSFLENHKNNQDFLSNNIKANEERQRMEVEETVIEFVVDGNDYVCVDVEKHLAEMKQKGNTSQLKVVSSASDELSRTVDTPQGDENLPEAQNSSSALDNSQVRKKTGSDKHESERLINNVETGSKKEKDATDDDSRSIRERIKDEYNSFMSTPEMKWRLMGWKWWKSESFVIQVSLIASWLLSFGSNELNVYNDETIAIEGVARVEGGMDLLNLERNQKYFPDTVLYEDATIKFSFIMSCITKKEYLDVVEWEYDTYPLPHPVLTKAIDLAAEQFENDDDVLVLDRDEIYVVGDIHGHILDLHRHISNVLYTTNQTILFLGDYVDRGMRGLDVVLMIAVLKIQYPKRVYFLHGNHEDSDINFRYGFLDECIDTFGFTVGGHVYFQSILMFTKMPMAAIANRVWCAHGGISHLMKDRQTIIKKLKKEPKTDEERQMRRDTVWSDPTPLRALWSPSTRWSGGVLDYGYKAVEKFMESCKVIGIIRAHFPCEDGVQAHFGKLCLTVYGSTNNSKKNKACAAIIRRDGIVSLQRINNKGLDPGDGVKRPPHEKQTLRSFFPKVKKLKKRRHRKLRSPQ